MAIQPLKGVVISGFARFAYQLLIEFITDVLEQQRPREGLMDSVKAAMVRVVNYEIGRVPTLDYPGVIDLIGKELMLLSKAEDRIIPLGDIPEHSWGNG